MEKYNNNVNGYLGFIKKAASSGDRRKSEKAAVFSKLRQVFADLVYPPDIYCIGCGGPIDPGCLYSLCETCIKSIKWSNKNVCEICGKALEDWYPDSVCSECKNAERYFSAGVSCVVYKSVVKDIIKKLKYGGESHIGRILGEMLAESIEARDIYPDLILPVPMYRKKQRIRGYNQAELIAAFTAERIGVDWSADVLERVKPTQPMSRLDKEERRQNLEGAFRVTREGMDLVSDSRVMLVDDIFTTGITMDSCAEILLSAGASEVYSASIAAGYNQRSIPDSDKYTGKQ